MSWNDELQYLLDKEDLAKVAFLHGCCQTKEMFASLAKPYIGMLDKKFAKITHLEGQYDHSRSGKMWFRSEFDFALIGTDVAPSSEVDETLDHVEEQVRSSNINMLIGFSQGGNVVDSYLRLRNGDGHIKSAVIFNGYSFPRYHDLTPSVLTLVYVSSDADEIVKPDQLHNNYPESTCLTHDKGHKLQASKPFARSVIEAATRYHAQLNAFKGKIRRHTDFALESVENSFQHQFRREN